MLEPYILKTVMFNIAWCLLTCFTQGVGCSKGKTSQECQEDAIEQEVEEIDDLRHLPLLP